jgi:hypothetical protein
MNLKPIKPKKDKKCGYLKCHLNNGWFTPNPWRFNQKTHDNIECAIGYVNQQEEKKAAKDWSKEKEIIKTKLKSHSEYLKDLEKIFNEFIRLRDKDNPCISCGTTKDVQYHAGHYFSVGAYPNLRFNEDNVHKQCGMNCNKQKHGNIIEYTPKLLQKIGLQRFEKLAELKNQVLKLTIYEITELKINYKLKIKELKNGEN